MKVYKGIITENYVANELKASGLDLLYWQSSRDSEVDFLIATQNNGVIPIEAKAEANTQSKSLYVYNKLYNPKYMIRISSKDFGFNPVSKIKSIPLYAVFLRTIIKILTNFNYGSYLTVTLFCFIETFGFSADQLRMVATLLFNFLFY